MAQSNQFKLLASRRFMPLFLSLLSSVFNDNLFKNSLLVILAFHLAKAEANTLINLASSLYVIPYFLFSLAAGQLADKYEKGRVIRIIKAAEILIGVLGAIALLTDDRVLSFIVLILFATHTAFFSPVRYAILPQHLKQSELLGGNGLAQVASFSGVLVGTIVGTLLAGDVGQGKPGLLYLSLVMVTVAILGYLASRAIPLAPSSAPNLKIDWNPISQTLRIMREVIKTPTVFYAIIANSWFWLFSTAYLTQVPSYVRNVLGASEPIITILLCCLTVGVATGSLMCESLSRGRIELGLVTVGGLGMTVAGLWLGILSGDYQMLSNASLIQFLQSDGGFIILFITTFLGIAGGIFIVPLYTVIQERTAEQIRAQVISVNNVLNAVFVVIISFAIIGLLGPVGMTIPQVFTLLAVLNFALLVLLLLRMPEMLFDTLSWLTYILPRRTKYEGIEQIPSEGSALLIARYSNLLTPFIVSGATQRKVRFIPSDAITNSPRLHALLRKSDYFPKNYYEVEASELKRKHNAIHEAEANRDILCILIEENSRKEITELVTLLKENFQSTSLPLIPLSIQGSFGYKRNLKTIVQAGNPIPLSEISPELLSDNLKGAE
ncbi:MFS transporter [Microbulbifer sp. A4B17]|uniref:MFS transporter n=1 Tax=Microbulbifer sp. A4B17 TaxID=359370 RepID=UPI000D52B470|nr:MFS transporter [Microbulbifer sp. A4B17]AWF79907.1 MFS transporter [Microbulbifer sp. A4B17]